MSDLIMLGVTIFGPIVAYYLNWDSRKKHLCMIVLALTGFSFWAFTTFANPEVLYLTLIGLEIAAVGGVYAVFYPPDWKNEGYLLGVCALILLSAANSIFYWFSRYFPFYAEMADVLAALTITWMVLRSDWLVLYGDRLFDGMRHRLVNNHL